MTKWLPRVMGGALVVLILIQFVPVAKTNPPIETEIPAPDAVKTVLRQSCFDCHSNETVWPWYSRVAPVSWFLKHNVEEAREEMNFTAWNRIEPEKREKQIAEVWEEVEEGHMPPWFYLIVHAEARLSATDREILRSWSSNAAPASGHDRHDH